MDVELYGLFFKAFSNKTRLNIISLLSKSPKTVSQLCNSLKLEQSRISHNLKCLRNCGFVDFTKNGKERVYTIDQNSIKPLLSLVDKHINKYKSRVKKCGVIVQ